MSQLVKYRPAQIKPYPCRILVSVSIVTGIALLTDPQKVLGADADSCVPYHNPHASCRFLPIPGIFMAARLSCAAYANRDTALPCVFDGVRQKLVNHKNQPFFICPAMISCGVYIGPSHSQTQNRSSPPPSRIYCNAMSAYCSIRKSSFCFCLQFVIRVSFSFMAEDSMSSAARYALSSSSISIFSAKNRRMK